jgi:hypothetical protein
MDTHVVSFRMNEVMLCVGAAPSNEIGTFEAPPVGPAATAEKVMADDNTVIASRPDASVFFMVKIRSFRFEPAACAY